MQDGFNAKLKPGGLYMLIVWLKCYVPVLVDTGKVLTLYVL